MMIGGVVLAIVAILLKPRARWGERDQARLLRLAGTATVLVGSLLTVAGLVALTILVADADSTLFLYTDRVVVALAGVIVLVPAIALVVGGWAILAVGRELDGRGDHD